MIVHNYILIMYSYLCSFQLPVSILETTKNLKKGHRISILQTCIAINNHQQSSNYRHIVLNIRQMRHTMIVMMLQSHN
jgi:hypothetical protein